ncbi:MULTISPECIES: DUF1150 family protein [Methylobacterium]|jgi:hypothetical protein|uniref:DUF1150 domain-containing protein n=1 Tax=Methylobacterium isbiliense TaxID=315478 RepID=A0ABQ4SGW0_9HYPH|nr:MULTISPECIES: DUF1150 domain-containing protein [Methylobacterium]MBY0296487.1 DUF1150 domain-containing protein [Methylobacterium sp.]MDN3626210.1 DUF1150 domain-containing protein [Methylobacterium isbiliense]GJE00993.1 hypothetical protein GMJLKIPL_2921 [Methylobacterium isbiliense]
MTDTTFQLDPTALAALGEGHVAYVKPMRSEDVKRLFPQAPDLSPGLNLFALLSASGAPILLTDSMDAAIANAWAHDLQALSLH